jgi:hypothetical protein
MLTSGSPIVRTLPSTGRDTSPTSYPLVHSSSLEASHPLILSGRLSTVVLRQHSATPPWRSSRRSGADRWPASPPRPSVVARLPPSPWYLLPTATFSSTWSIFSTRATRSDLLHRTCCGLLHRSDELRATGELHIATSLHSQATRRCCTKSAYCKYMFQVLCFRGMLQVFRIGVAKVDHDVAHVAMAIHVCFKYMF